ncbi:Gfo/Idh/MocA family protein [Maritalea mediterranea]|uniref:Gfo/Idh/MocA family oxidoreductase n=1 Tax=Maritalea mediterranea TaxID=2909667 RepID=A0ABS9E2I3_9HYPH|nr:Gfo/Idh/MocA family oxidoreductase [Maritalea mediterranea]MCF4097022.1 Gfo/Idh/MocA family oxidoreductase [Maritalea mediterranea]
MSKTIAVIGLGIMGQRMLQALDSYAAFEVTHMWDPSEAAQKAALAIAPDAAIPATAEAAIDAVDLVYLACPPAPRHLYAKYAADLDKPLFLEKPLGTDVLASRELVRHLDAAKVPTAVNFVQATGEPLAHIQSAQSAGEMGALTGIDIFVSYAQWPRAWQVKADWLRFRAEGGMTREVISHFLFFAERVMGPVELEWAHVDYPDDELCETDLAARLTNQNGIKLNIFASVGGAQPDRQEIFVKGENQSFSVRQFSELWVTRGGEFTQLVDPGANARIDGLHAQLDHFARLIEGKDHLLATPQEALSVQEKIEAMLGV